MSDDGEKPTFSELRDALMPPGTDREALWRAIKSAHSTGGHVPGMRAPDISNAMDAAAYRAIMGVSEPASPPPGRASASMPADPFSQGAPAAAALHEMFTDFISAGFTEEQATSVLGKMLAAYGREGQDGQ